MPRRLTEEQMLNLLLESDVDELSDEDNGAEEEIYAENDSEESEDELLQSEETESPALLPQSKTRILKWFCKPEGISVQLSEEPTWEVGNRELWTPFAYFSEYFDDKVWALVSEQSNMYALQKGLSLKSTSSEYKRLVGAHIIAGCMKLPQIRMYYRPQIRVPAITQIPRDRLFKLRNNMHFVDNMAVTEKDKENKLWKVQPIIDVVLHRCKLIPKPKKCSIDEQMIPFSGTTSLKQYVKGKPNPVGLKNFVLASPDGLILDFFIYQGAKTWPDGKPNKQLGIGGSVVAKLATDLSEGSEIFIDRYFTSINLLQHLLEKSIFATGTIQLNRMPKELVAKLSKDKAMLDKGRGTFEQFVREDEKISVIKWMDSRSVMMATTSVGARPIQSVRRWEKRIKKYINIDCPNAISRYNKCMGGVDLADRHISYYRIAIRTKKWPSKVFWHLIDLALCNSWVMYKKDKYASGENRKNIMDLLEFKLYVAECLIADANKETELEEPSESEMDEPQKKKSKTVPLPPKEVRKTSNKHLPVCAVSDKNKFMRCRKEGCSQKTRFKCIACGVFLCITNERQCFMEFHT